VRKRKVTEMSPEFVAWLDKALHVCQWSDQELARRAKVSHSVLSKMRTGRQSLGYDVCRDIANALGADEVMVLRLAGHLAPVKDVSVQTRTAELVATASQLSEKDMTFLQELAELLNLRAALQKHNPKPEA
jgi:transcriptional regulator with XRE-family HTH domain